MRKLFFVLCCTMISFGILVAQDAMKKDEQVEKKEMKEMKMEKKDAKMDKKEDMMKKGAMYCCSMHPEVKSDKPGKCSKCGMEMTMAKGEMKKHHMKKNDEMKKDSTMKN